LRRGYPHHRLRRRQTHHRLRCGQLRGGGEKKGKRYFSLMSL
jgi:hypothetical protein